MDSNLSAEPVRITITDPATDAVARTLVSTHSSGLYGLLRCQDRMVRGFNSDGWPAHRLGEWVAHVHFHGGDHD